MQCFLKLPPFHWLTFRIFLVDTCLSQTLIKHLLSCGIVQFNLAIYAISAIFSSRDAKYVFVKLVARITRLYLVVGLHTNQILLLKLFMNRLKLDYEIMHFFINRGKVKRVIHMLNCFYIKIYRYFRLYLYSFFSICNYKSCDCCSNVLLHHYHRN